jgi:hypothetical protein
MKTNNDELVLLSQDEFEALEMLQIKGGAGGPDGEPSYGQCNIYCPCIIHIENCPDEIN